MSRGKLERIRYLAFESKAGTGSTFQIGTTRRPRVLADERETQLYAVENNPRHGNATRQGQRSVNWRGAESLLPSCCVKEVCGSHWLARCHNVALLRPYGSLRLAQALFP